MAGSNFLRHKAIPSATGVNSTKSAPTTVNFANGITTYKPNDTMESGELRLAQDARFDRVGEYGTRKGYKMLMKPLGEHDVVSNWTEDMIAVNAEAIDNYSFEVEEDMPITSIMVKLSKTSDAEYVVPKINIKVDGEIISSSCVNYANLSTTQDDCEVYFMDTPNVFEGETVEIELDVQSGKLSHLNVGVVGDDMKIAVRTATDGAIDSIFEANIDGEKTILFNQGSKLYRRSSNGTVTLIRTMPDGVKTVRFNQDINKIRYVNGKEYPHILDPSNNWADSVITPTDLKTDTELTGMIPSNIMDGTSDNIIYFNANVDTEAFWTYPYGYTWSKSPSFTTTATLNGEPGHVGWFNISTVTPSGIQVGDWITGQGTATCEVTSISGETVYVVVVDTTPQTISSYDKFASDFYQNFPAIETGDPLTAMANLGGVIYFFTRRNKYLMYSQSADSWSQSQSNAQNGTFSQESVVCDLNYAYFASDNGIYVFDGTSETSLTKDKIQNMYDAIPNKESIKLDLFRNRLYVYYASQEGGVNDSCLVFNINLKVWESFDTNTWINATSARQNVSNRFICGHSRVGMILINEADNNDYSDIGQAINFNLMTGYQHFGATSRLKRIVKWRPEFAVSQQPYTIECGYALDFTDQVKYAFSINLEDQTPVYTGYVWDNPSDHGVPVLPTTRTTLTRVNGEFFRCQIRYQHIAAFEPVIFRSHTLSIQTQRIR